MVLHGVRNNIIILWALFTTGVVIWQLVQGVPLTHDAEANIARFAANYQSLRDGQIPPRWAGDLNYRYGSPVLSFFYPLPGYIASLFHASGVSYEGAWIMLVLGSFCGSMYFWYRYMRLFYTDDVSLISAVIFASAPYAILNMFVRGDVGEVMAYALIPAVLFAIHTKTPVAGGIWYGLLVVSHTIVAYLATPVLMGYGIVVHTSLSARLKHAALFIIGLLLSGFYWIPALYEQKYVLGSRFVGDMYTQQFIPLVHLVFSPWGYGATAGIPEGQAPQVGPFITLLAGASLFLTVTQKHEKHVRIFWLLVTSLFITAIAGLMPFMWKVVPYLPMVQFPWRLLSVVSVALVVLATYTVNYIYHTNRMFLYVLLAGIAVYTLSIVRVNGRAHHDDSFYEYYTGTTYYHGQTTPIWTAGDAYEMPPAPVEVIGGDALISGYSRHSQKHSYTVTSVNESIIMDNTVFFPGWRVFVNDLEVPIQFQDPSHRGIITFTVPSGVSRVTVRFAETTVRVAANILSGTSVAGVALWYFVKRKRFI